MTSNKDQGRAFYVPSLIYNNNPFNIRKTNISWLGEVVESFTGSNFERFNTLELGIRAGLKNLENGYFSKQMTLRQIIERYAPKSENNTESYIRYVSTKTGIPQNGYITGQRAKIAFAIAVSKFETGKDINHTIIQTNEKYKIFI